MDLHSSWQDLVAASGGWLGRQSQRPGPAGGAAGVARALVHRSARLLSEVGGELARATAAEPGAGHHHRGGDGHTHGDRSRNRRVKPDG